jgi:hypothetical protein
MGIEAATYLNQLVATNPTGLDAKSEGDNHIRLLKSVLQATFPNISGAMTATQARLNLLNSASKSDLTAGTAPAFTVTTPQVPITAYENNQIFFVCFHAAGTTGSNTLNISGQGNAPLKQFDSSGALTSGIITSDFHAIVIYDISAASFVILNALPEVSEFAVGDYKLSDRTSYPSGYRWLLCDGKTIGNGSSGATGRANADVEDLFAFLWESHSNTLLAIQDSAGVATSRGISAAADFAANKRLPLLNWSGLGIRIHHNSDAAYETDTTRVLGSYQADSFQGHHHTTNATSGTTSRDGGSFSTSAASAATVSDPITDGVNGTPRTSAETRMKNRSTNVFIRY